MARAGIITGNGVPTLAAGQGTLYQDEGTGNTYALHGSTWVELARNAAGAILVTSLAASGSEGQALINHSGVWTPSTNFSAQNLTTTGSINAAQFTGPTALALATAGTTRATIDNATVSAVVTNRFTFVPDVAATIGMAQSLVSTTSVITLEGQAAKTGSGNIGGTLALNAGLSDGGTDRGSIIIGAQAVRIASGSGLQLISLIPRDTGTSQIEFGGQNAQISHIGSSGAGITGREMSFLSASWTGAGSQGEKLSFLTGTGDASAPLANAGPIQFRPANIMQLELYIDSNVTQVFRFFNTFLLRGANGANPTIADPEGSLAIRYDAGNGSAWIRRNSTWQELARNAAGAINVSSLTGTLPLANGGTGASSLAAGLLHSNGSVVGVIADPAASTGKALIWGGAAWAAGTDFVAQNLTTTGTVTATAFISPTTLLLKVGSTTRMEIASTGAVTLDAYTNAGLLYNDASGVLSTVTNTIDGKVLTMVSGLPAWFTPTVSWLNVTGKPDVSDTVHGLVTSITGTGKVLLSGGGTAAIWGAITDTYVSDVAWGKLTGVPDASTSTKGIVKLAQDLGGTALLPTVLSITGVAGAIASVRCDALIWDATTSPSLSQLISTAGDGVDFSIFGQAGQATGNTSGGAIVLFGGVKHGTGKDGGVQLGLGGGDVMFETKEVATNKFMTIFNHLVTATTGSTGADPGDLTSMFGVCLAEPTTSPSGGNTIVYSTSKGLRQRCGDGVRVN